jgi:hypothetical protein
MLSVKEGEAKWHGVKWIPVYVTPEQWMRLQLMAEQALTLQSSDPEGASHGWHQEQFTVLNDDLTIRVVNVLFPYGDGFDPMLIEERKEFQRLSDASGRLYERAHRRHERETARNAARRAKKAAKRIAEEAKNKAKLTTTKGAGR